MGQVKEHYDNLLGSVYSWILGDFATACARNVRLFEQLGIQPVATGVAVDLGAGPGVQSIPLADRGFDVLAIDFCEGLLDELRGHAGDRPIRTVCADISGFRERLDHGADLIVCMGDTLVHLPDHEAAENLLVDIAAALVPGGSTVISIRDYDAPGPAGADRFIPIRSSADRIFTCFLEYQDDIVQVHDLLQEKSGEGWRLSISGYRKLRLGMDRVQAVLEAEGLAIVTRLDDHGMLVIHARK